MRTKIYFVLKRVQQNFWQGQFSRQAVLHTRSRDGEAAIAVVCGTVSGPERADCRWQ